ncbi:hypothetical protein SteCoe_4735 [Stentor coeruleus]|uniref:Uncharacterized protein n=1 Tax=Stentor coeruleus TaxID=5963 RepID=A0A1R2CTZ5_9CILI|nr:hypothetical protein SteCoe_4735 [Stentor coeruleus]
MLNSTEETTPEIPAEEVENLIIPQTSKLPTPSGKSQSLDSLFSYPKILNPKTKTQNPNNNKKISQKKSDIPELGDTEDTYEDSFNQCHTFHKTWDTFGYELYKVTEYNESMECSVSEEGSDLAIKINDFSNKATNSITDKFPKFSVASLSMSDTSYQNALDIYKKSYLDYAEPLEIVTYTSPERTESDVFEKGIMDSPVLITTNLPTLGEGNPFRSTLDNRPEHCACPKCAIF